MVNEIIAYIPMKDTTSNTRSCLFAAACGKDLPASISYRSWTLDAAGVESGGAAV